MGLRRKWIDPEQTWLAEEHANTSLGEQERVLEHRCSQCYHKGFGKSPIRCRNEPGGA